MADSNFKIVTVNYLQDVYGGKGMSHDTVVVTKTATMESGSILKADGTEAAVADAATATLILDFAAVDVASVGDVIAASAVKAYSQVKTGSLKFSDAAYAGEALTALAGKGVEVVA